jgi:hypothetical protein
MGRPSARFLSLRRQCFSAIYTTIAILCRRDPFSAMDALIAREMAAMDRQLTMVDRQWEAMKRRVRA